LCKKLFKGNFQVRGGLTSLVESRKVCLAIGLTIGSDWAYIHLGIGYASFKGPGPKKGGGNPICTGEAGEG